MRCYVRKISSPLHSQLKAYITLVERNNAKKKLVKEAEEEIERMAEMVER